MERLREAQQDDDGGDGRVMLDILAHVMIFLGVQKLIELIFGDEPADPEK
jgi:hypothetical protein